MTSRQKSTMALFALLGGIVILLGFFITPNPTGVEAGGGPAQPMEQAVPSSPGVPPAPAPAE